MAEQGHGTPVAQGPCWVIRKDDASDEAWAGLLIMRLSGWGKVLLVFDSEDDALFFLRGWEPVPRVSLEALQTARAQLTSALLGALSDVGRVVFNPLPEPELQDTIRFASICRGAFVDLVLGRGKVWSDREEHHDSRWLWRGAVRP
jgi:hypothetical protein